jgi:cell division protein FtsL
MLRILHLGVIAVLVMAAAFVYKIKFDAAVQAERVAKVRSEIRHEREQIALLRAQWARLDNPARIEELANRHLDLRPIQASQFDDIARLPERPRPLVPPNSPDAIGALIHLVDESQETTGSTRPAARATRGSAPSPEN